MRSDESAICASARASSKVRLSGVVISVVGRRRLWRARSLLLVSPVRRPMLHGICRSSTGVCKARAVSAARARMGVIHSTVSGSAGDLRLREVSTMAAGLAKRLSAANHTA